MRIGKTLKEYRNRKGISDLEAAEALSIRVVKYRTLEEGISEADLDVLIRIADFFDVTLDDLLERSRPGSGKPDLKDVLEQQPLYDGFKLSARDLQTIGETAAKLAKQSWKLQEFARIVGDDPELVRKLQDLKILGVRLDNRSIVSTIEKALA